MSSFSRRYAFLHPQLSPLVVSLFNIRKLGRSFDRSLRKCRSEQIKTIGDNLMTNNSKPFWKFIKSLRYSSTGVLSLNALNGTATSTIDKADALSNQFQSVFTKEDCSNLPTLNSLPTKSMLPI